MKANELFVSDLSNIDITPEIKAQNIVTSPNFKKIVDNLLNSPNLLTALKSIINQYHMNAGNFEEISKNSTAVTNMEKAVEKAY
jgi:hypothetical protein